MQPHCEQSGVPPNWQGVTRLLRSAVSESVVRAKMHSAGDRGGFRVPAFRSSWDGMLARVSHTGMLLFQPTARDEVALSDLKPVSGDADYYFWLVDAPFTDLKRGLRVDHAHLAALLRD